jgi:osmoprotectant transport system substrate-binding protein
MRKSRSGVAGAIALSLVLLASACGSSGGDTKKASSDDSGSTSSTAESGGGSTCKSFKGSGNLTIGGTNFSEQEIVADIYAMCLKDAGFNVSTKLKIGSREIVLPALEKGDISLYPEYVGTLLTFLNGTPTPDLQATTTALRTELAKKNINVLEPAPAEDKNGFAVTKATADKYHLTKISDLAPVAKDLVFGAGPECSTRPLCLVGLQKTYGLNFKDVKKLDSGGPLTKDALQNGQIQVGLIFTSDGAVAARGFVVLQDDKNLQPADNVVPVIRKANDSKVVDDVLNAISAKLTTASLSEANKSVDVDKADPSDAAAKWLKDMGFTS